MPDDRASFWVRWHARYEDPGSDLGERLEVVQQRLLEAIDRKPGPLRLISVCAGQGRDVVGVLAGHPRSSEVEALLVELDDHNVGVARESVAGAGLDGVDVVRADASVMGVYRDAVPADVLLLCGIFGNVSDEDIRTTVANAPRLCAPGAVVIWTRRRDPPDVTPAIRRWFAQAGFEELAFDSPGLGGYAVGTNRLVTDPLDFCPDLRMFSFLE
jgi:ubiquinone/menaquinone biosynthesis C-methylase UbiE